MLRPNGDTSSIDLSAFDTEAEFHEESLSRSVTRAKRNRDVNRSPARRGNRVMPFLMAGLVCAGLVNFLMGQIALGDAQMQLQESRSRIAAAQEEQTRLQTKLDAMATLDRVEEYAARNGLIKEQRSQVRHIVINVEELVEVALPEEPGFWGSVGDLFSRLVNG